MSINWNSLRPWDGSQQTAFEEICCQLAACEAPFGSSARFIRKGTPDAGIECYWVSPSGEEVAWQAKFFTESPGVPQWNQLDESVRAALDKHPNLTRYIVCLPIDRADPRITDKNGKQKRWFMDRWNEKVTEWQGWATAKGKTVSFDYWGEHEIFLRLSSEQHKGRYLFWFNQEVLSISWFEKRLNEAIANAGERYTPELNVDLPVTQLFDGLGRTKSFFIRLKSLYGNIRRSYQDTTGIYITEVVPTEYEALRAPMARLLGLLEAIEPGELAHIPFKDIENLSTEAEAAAYQYQSALRRIVDKKKFEPGRAIEPNTQREDLARERYSADELRRSLYTLIHLAASTESQLANVPALLLLGDAGTGKTHLFCDISKHRIARGAPTVLLLGQHLSYGDPWPQLLGLLKLTCSPEEFLGALNSSGQASGEKALLLIDALNEGEGRRIWKNHLPGFLTLTREYPWISVAVSVRTSYEPVIVPTHLTEENIIREKHTGFAEHEYEATKTFFDAYGIVRPAIPLLNPEFQNPLFLKLFCKGLKGSGLTEIPRGFHGVTAVFDTLLATVNKKLANEDFLDYDEKLNIVQTALNHIAEAMSDAGTQMLPRNSAIEVVGKVLKTTGGYQQSLFRHLISEGLLAEDYTYVGKNEKTGEYEYAEVIRLTYERFADHLIVKNYLDRYILIPYKWRKFQRGLSLLRQLASYIPGFSDAINRYSKRSIGSAFNPETPLGKLLDNEYTSYQNKGILDALSIQLPERTGKELAEIVPRIASYESVRSSFVQSLIWRSLTAFSETTLEYINTHVLESEEGQSELFNAFLTLAATPNHPYNANKLHEYLHGFTLAERDALWSIFLHNQYGEHGVVDRLIEWSWEIEDKSHISDEALLLASTALTWFLTSSNRFVRDRATKALVSLLTHRIHILNLLMERFHNVNDLYITERLYAVAYGCVLRSTDAPEVASLTKNVYQWIFADGKPIPHLLIRDYARGVVETGIHLDGEIDEIDVSKIRPPYCSNWPETFPTEEEIKSLNKYQSSDVRSSRSLASRALYYSVMGFEDFARYIIGTNSDAFFWSPSSLSSPRIPTWQERKSAFEAVLTEEQLQLFHELEKVQSQSILTTIRAQIEIVYIDTEDNDTVSQLSDQEKQASDEEYITEDDEITLAKSMFFSSLDKEKLSLYESLGTMPFWPQQEQEDLFDLKNAQRWVLKRVYDLGWTPDLFADFDGYLNISRSDRSSHKPERIGKKYQWLAWHEFLAYAADNLQIHRRFGNEDSDYIGPWQMSRRDIDPSCLLAETKASSSEQQDKLPWWAAVRYDAWDKTSADLEWLQKSSDLPDVDALINVVDPNDGTQWIVMDTFLKWQEPVPPEEDPNEVARRQLWYMTRAYVVKKDEAESFFTWACDQDFMGRWMPEVKSLHDVFLGEFHWSPAYLYHSNEYYGIQEWHDVSHGAPGQVSITTIEYTAEGNDYDCSIASGYTITLPSKGLADRMQLSWCGQEGKFFAQDKTLVAYDPSIRKSGPSTLLIRREALLHFLKENDYEMFWTVLGEKIIMPGSFSRDHKGRLNISGACRFVGNTLEKTIKAEFKPSA
ncbi:AVAST type 2 anti-phage system protein Avs2 [Armatimonas rosea]|uniref:ATP-binding protein n=1 Tax=Armatimonas rosea TaxID=685828 RepID=A0A7W9SXV5_ARMRO|nr:AVAST type 2 anti-phage system protein Avs2 [Armatimonas rosea]MBB6053923.1 hypothetical protein [Armatimonas rosea]